MELKDSQTKENLMRAFAGESQARNRYTFAAKIARQNSLFVIEQVFNLTANQEKEHAEVFSDFLRELDGQEIKIPDASYPVNQADSIEKQLAYAVENETKEGEEVYRAFGDTALQEGFNQIAGKFYMIADIEKVHAYRFDQLLSLLQEGKLFASDIKTGWMCLNCGYVIEATNAPQNCPVCDGAQGYFVRLTMAPFTTPEMDVRKEQDLGK